MAEHNVGQASTFLVNGQMKRIKLEDQELVLARVGGEYYAFGGSCTHYGAPLDEGVLDEHRVICPWHHACFDIRNGLRVEPPALNDLPHFPVHVVDDQVMVTLPQTNETEPPAKTEADRAEKRTFVIVGGGAAGNAAAEELRRAGFEGRIIILSAVPNVPVDRPNLSKDYLAGKAEPGWMALRGDESWYQAHDIELRLVTPVTRIDAEAHTVTTDLGDIVHYDKLLLATGGIPRHLSVPGADLAGIFMLRTLHDADKIIEAAQAGKRALVIGTSFIGMEVAASLAGGRGVDVTVVGMDAVPFLHVLGDGIGRMLRKEHEDNGVKFQLNSMLARFTGEKGHVTGLELRNGKTLSADFVVVGMGVSPVTDFLFDSGLTLDDKDRSVRVNAHLQTSHPDVFAAGDIVRWDDGSARGKRIEHWRVAEQQGVAAARNMLGATEDFNDHIPFFWTNQWSVGLNYVGHAEKWEHIIYRGGKPEDKKFLAFFIHKDHPLAVVGSGYDKELDAIEIIMRHKLPLSLDQIKDETFDLVGYALQAKP